MTFKVIDTKTGKEPTYRVIHNIAKKGGLITMDIDQFFVGEDGSLVLADDCENITYCDTKRFMVEPQQKTGHWIEDEQQIHVVKTYHCSECGYDAWDERTKFCSNCGARMDNWYTPER